MYNFYLPVNKQYALDSLPFALDSLPLTFLSLINKGFQRPELIELIEQEGATRFFEKIWVIFGACGEGSASILSNPTVAKGGMLGNEKIRVWGWWTD